MHFTSEILNAKSTKITFLWNFCHLFLVLLYEWNTSINDSFQFFWGQGCPMGVSALKGGGGVRKNHGMGGVPHAPPLWKTLGGGFEIFHFFYGMDKTFEEETFASKNTAKFNCFTMPKRSSGLFLSIKFCIKRILTTKYSNLQ